MTAALVARISVATLVATPEAAPSLVVVAAGAAATLVAAERGPAGPQGAAGPQGPPGAVPIYTAAAVLSGEKAVMFSGPGLVTPADPTALGYVYAGIALNAAQSGGAVAVASTGDVIAPFWSWIAGRPVFAAPGGNLTQAPPITGRSHLIGWALDANTIHLAPDPVIPIL